MEKNTIREKERERNPSWYDRAQYSKNVWMALFQRIAEFRAKGERSKCKDAIDTLLIVIFKQERDIVKNYIKELDAQFVNPSKADIDKKYDLILEKIVDVLEESRWLTREGTSKMEEGFEGGHEGFDEEGTIEDSEKIDMKGTTKNAKKSIFGGKKRKRYQV